eukprot:CAMPEP_0181306668 /NCGR_PEP_ID=MMETSP1101-20121128/10433_1 /TAXON_ID=46948 /ORGANISM="Rhodomonas abbreviata, Strain Caron Lab Isolate" /LENGTH=390 /DNA_ID=CAMNT_0023412761 /DNA_START=105 /DNA_END=1280 /DNA_ORIENTATION=-
MPRGDFFGGKNMGLPMRSRQAPTRSFAVLDKGRSLGSHDLEARAVGSSSLKNSKSVSHVEDGTPVGYSDHFEAFVAYSKDRWCSPACQCLHFAAASGNIQMAEAAANGQKPFTRKHGLDEVDDAGRTPAMVAAWRSKVDTLSWLVERGADLNRVDKNERSVMHWATLATSRYEVFEVLCGKNVDVRKLDRLGDTVLHKIVALKDIKCATILCEYFPLLTTVKTRKGKLPIELAAPNKALMTSVSTEAAAAHVKAEQDRMNVIAAELEEKEKAAVQRQQLQEYEELTNKRRQSVVQTAGVGHFAKKLEGVLGGLDAVPDERDDWAALEEGLDSLEEEVEEERQAAEQEKREEEQEDGQVNFFSAMIDMGGSPMATMSQAPSKARHRRSQRA